MDTYNPLELGRATGYHSRHHGKDKNNNAQLLLDGDSIYNRQLVRVWDGVQVYEITELRVDHYEVETAFEIFRFSRLYLAFDKQVRLTEERSAHRAS
jgi:hypothetical protein